MCFKRNFWFSMRCKKRGQQFFCSRCCCCCYTINLVQFIWMILRIFFNPNSFSMKNLTKFCSHRGIKFVSFSSFFPFSSGLLWFRFLNLAMLFNRTHTHTHVRYTYTHQMVRHLGTYRYDIRTRSRCAFRTQ